MKSLDIKWDKKEHIMLFYFGFLFASDEIAPLIRRGRDGSRVIVDFVPQGNIDNPAITAIANAEVPRSSSEQQADTTVSSTRKDLDDSADLVGEDMESEELRARERVPSAGKAHDASANLESGEPGTGERVSSTRKDLDTSADPEEGLESEELRTEERVPSTKKDLDASADLVEEDLESEEPRTGEKVRLMLMGQETDDELGTSDQAINGVHSMTSAGDNLVADDKYITVSKSTSSLNGSLNQVEDDIASFQLKSSIDNTDGIK